MELGLTIPLQRHLKIKELSYGKECNRLFCWDLHIISLNGPSRYTFTLFDLNWLEWSNLVGVFLNGLCNSFQSIGISSKTTEAYLRQACVTEFTKTHGRREVAYLNCAWNDVLAFDYILDCAVREQPLLDHAVNTKPVRCAGRIGVDTAEKRLLQIFQETDSV